MYRSLGFKKRATTTGKVAIPQSIREEIEFHFFFHEVAHKVEKYKIPHCLILNLDQTLTKFVPASSRTQAQIGSDNVPVAA